MKYQLPHAETNPNPPFVLTTAAVTHPQLKATPDSLFLNLYLFSTQRKQRNVEAAVLKHTNEEPSICECTQQHRASCVVVSNGQHEGRNGSSLWAQEGKLYAKVEPFQPTLAAFMSK